MNHDFEGTEATAVGGGTPARGRAAPNEGPAGRPAAFPATAFPAAAFATAAFPEAAFPAAASRAVSQRRAEAMRALFPKLSAWRASGDYLAELAAVFGDLAQAQDLADLERRLSEVAQRRRAGCR